MQRTSAALAGYAAPLAALAADASSPGPGLGSVLQVSLGLGVVLAMVAGAAWLVRRLGVGPGRSDGSLRLHGGIAVGQRERVVVVEVQDTWIVVGVAPGRVSALYSMPRPEGVAAPAAAAQPPARAFGEWLRRATERHHA